MTPILYDQRLCPCCGKVRLTVIYFIGDRLIPNVTCVECERVIAKDNRVNDLKTAALTAQLECPGAVPFIHRAIQAAEGARQGTEQE